MHERRQPGNSAGEARESMWSELARAPRRSLATPLESERAMPHDGIPRNGRMYGAGAPGWIVALALALAFSIATLAIATATGFFGILVPALVVVVVGYGLYALVAASRRRSRPWPR